MKILYTLLILCCTATFARADDLTATQVAADFGKHNGSIVLTITGGIAPYTVSWTGPGGFTDTTVDLDTLVPGTYCVTVTDAFCGKAELCITVDEKPDVSAIRELAADAFKISPNPFSAGIQVLPGQAVQEPLQLSLYDISGRAVLQQELPSMPLSGYYMTTGNTLVPGVYLLQIRTAAGRYWQQRLVYNPAR